MVRIILINHKRGAWQALVQRAVADIPKIDQVRSADRRQREPRTLHATCRVSVACLRVPVCRRCARICRRCTGRSEQALPTTTLLPISSTSAPGLVTSAPGLADYKRSALCSTAFASRRFSLLFSEHFGRRLRGHSLPRSAPCSMPCRVWYHAAWDTVLCGCGAALCRSGQQ